MRNNAKITNQDLLYPELSYEATGAIFEVWKKLSPAFKESAYQKALAEEFKSRNIPFESQKAIPIYYNDKKVGSYVPDFLLDGKILIEIKHLPRLTFKENKQVWYYLKGTEYKLLLLVNFGGNNIEIKRRIYDKARIQKNSK
ncbi:MAG: GxxExxY protein [Candidatus Liptonbacteria bacterium]|nr:GxxExxY protein [Candidatus Liptonbacteria bacterium]